MRLRPLDAPLGAPPLEAVQDFFNTYYAPNNAVLSISGDFDPGEAMQLAKTYFGEIPARETPAFVEPAPPVQNAERTETMYDANATLPAFHFAYEPALSIPREGERDLSGHRHRNR